MKGVAEVSTGSQQIRYGGRVEKWGQESEMYPFLTPAPKSVHTFVPSFQKNAVKLVLGKVEQLYSFM